MITNDNYYSVNNKGLSQSKIKAFELDPNYMYRSCISGELKRKGSSAMTTGREVDSILTEVDKFQNTIIAPYSDFRSKEAREWKADQEALGKTVLKEDEYEDVMAIAIAIQSTSIWKDIEKNYIMQDILIVEDNELGPHFDCLYGKPDAYKIENGVCHLLDLKTSNDIDRRKFFYKAKELGYFKQLYFYSELLKHKYPEIKEFKYSFVVAETKEPYRVKLYSIKNQLIEEQEDEMQYLITQIANTTDFSKPDITWDDAEDIAGEDEFQD